MTKPIVCVDFDGVIHSYSSGWKGARIIPDPIVPGALEALVGLLGHFRVAILSSRSHQWGGRRAMKRYLRAEFIKASSYPAESFSMLPTWHQDFIAANNYNETWDHDIRAAAGALVHKIEWPLFKPPALITLDDRAVTFMGDWSVYTPEAIRAFRPWNKRSRTPA